MIDHNQQGGGASSSSCRLVDLDSLPSLPQLQTWVHRPQALAKCTISDVYEMRAVVHEGAGRYAGRDVFLLDRFPCRMVELVGWVAGVDEKEKTQVVYLDDGDGQHVMPVTVRLSLVEPSAPVSSTTSAPALTNTTPNSSTYTRHPGPTHFSSAKERKAQRRAAALAESKDKGKGRAAPVKVYERNDVRVGDVVRVKGKVDEWMRGKEWVRQVAVDPGAGGSITVVDPDEQYIHLRQVAELRRSLYSRPFTMPPASAASSSTPVMPTVPAQNGSTSVIDLTCSDTLSTTFDQSSEMSMDAERIKLCDPSRLRPSQLTDRTFRHYLLDHMTQQTADSMIEISFEGESPVRQALRTLFPEYGEVWSGSRQSGARGSGRAPFGPWSSPNVNMSDIDTNLTPRRSGSARAFPLKPSSAHQILRLQGFTIASLLEVPHLYDLAVLVVDEQSRKEEKRRRRRIRDGQATPKDLDVELIRQRQSKGWRLTDQERRGRMERLVKWVIRALSEEGVIVQVGLGPGRSGPGAMVDAYIPLTEQLLFPLLLPHIEAEEARRSKTFMRRTDERHGHGILLGEVVGRLRRFGEAGRWERVGEWGVEDALAWGEQRGSVKRVGRGWASAGV